MVLLIFPQDHVLKWLMIINEQLAIAKRERQCM